MESVDKVDSVKEDLNQLIKICREIENTYVANRLCWLRDKVNRI